jgi:outer membrane protein assembly factor BamB
MKLKLMQKLTMAAIATFLLAPVYGTVTGPGTISSLSANALDRSGYLAVLGSNFGGSGQVLIDGISAPVARWESTRIVAYVPETARLTTVPVQVVNESSQSSNTVNLTVIPRVANGRVKWRFQAASDYILQRPAVGPDGTIVVHDSSGNVYALRPDGGLKWIFTTRIFAAGPPSIGLDGTVYVADSSTITAIKPNGSLKWTFTEPPGGQGVIAGPTVGPDGNIYAVTDIGGLGALALSPAGQLLWSNTGDPVMAEQGQLGVEMSFGPSHLGGAVDQFYVTFDDFGSSERDHMYAFRLTGEQVWTIPLFMTKDTSGMMQQQRPIVGTDGTVFLSASVATGGNWSLNAFDPANGTLLRNYFPSPGLGMSVPTVGPDGAVYFGQSLSYLQAVSRDFIPKWTFFDGSILSYPVVSPANDIVFTGGAPNYGVPGFVRAFSTSSGQLLWSLDLGVENGGNQNMQSIPRFTLDGSTVYFGTVILGGTGSPFCFLYAVDATSSGGGIPCEDLLSFQARCQSNGSAHRLQAKLTLTDTSHSGEQVIITVDGHPFTVTINGNQAQLSLNNPAPGQHTIVLTDPAGCFPSRMPSCQ